MAGYYQQLASCLLLQLFNIGLHIDSSLTGQTTQLPYFFGRPISSE